MATTISYKLTRELLDEGVAAANARLYGKLLSGKRWYWDAARGLLMTAIAAVSLLLVMKVVERFIGRSLDIPAVVVGLAYGTTLFVVLNLTAGIARRNSSPYSSKGPTLAQQTAAFGDDELIITGPNFRYEYDWSNFEDVTLGASVLLLWTEPGMVIVVPRAAIGGAAAETALIGDIRRNMARAARTGTT